MTPIDAEGLERLRDLDDFYVPARVSREILHALRPRMSPKDSRFNQFVNESLSNPCRCGEIRKLGCFSLGRRQAAGCHNSWAQRVLDIEYAGIELSQFCLDDLERQVTIALFCQDIPEPLNVRRAEGSIPGGRAFGCDEFLILKKPDL